MTPGTYRALASKLGVLPDLQLFNLHQAFEIGDLQIQPFPVPHDAEEPSQFVFSSRNRKLGFLTDTGIGTAHIETMLSGCHALVLECNHDYDMLMRGAYPEALKARISSDLGHLDNSASAKILESLDCRKLEVLVAAHISDKNNTTELVTAALSSAMDCDPAWVHIADQANGLPWFDLN